MGKSSINGPFSMAMLNNQRVYIYISIYTQVQAEIDINASIHEHMKTCIHETVGTCTP